LGRTPKDIDFVVVVEPGTPDPWNEMIGNLTLMGFDIVTQARKFGTCKATCKKGFEFGGRQLRGAFDFVLARREVGGDGRYPDAVEAGTLYDDLKRRDFTMNAMAKTAAGQLIDPFDGRYSIENKRIFPVGDVLTRFREDHLRILRALRFHVTLGFGMCDSIYIAIYKLIEDSNAFSGVSDERMRDEMHAMFSHDTERAINVLSKTRLLHLFGNRLWLKPTLESR
jgi:tRNA nucleotidyltransferase/poly(A) polymerase